MKRLVSCAVGACLLVAGVACDSGDGGSDPVGPRDPISAPRSEETRVIGLVATMTGPDAARGEDAFEGADLGVHVLNRDLSPEEPQYELVTRDDSGDSDLAITAVAELANSPQTVGIVYAGPPEGLRGAEDVLASAGIPLMVTHGDPYSAHLLSPHVFQMTPPVLWQARRIAGYIKRDRRYERVAFLVERSTAGETVLDSLDIAFDDVPGTEVGTVTFGYATPEFEDFIEQLKASSVEAIVLHGTPTAATDLLTELAAAGSRYRSTDAARIDSAPRKVREKRARSDHWRPQVIAFDGAIAPTTDGLSAGVVASDTYARGAHYLPIPSVQEFREDFLDWWDSLPLGWEQRSYQAVRVLGWAAQSEARDLAVRLEDLQGRRFGGLDITFGPDDHTAVEQTSVGLWVVPATGDAPEIGELPPALPWVPLARGFSIDGDRTDVFPQDWRWLFRDPPPPRAPAPKLTKMRFGVASPRSDPLY